MLKITIHDSSTELRFRLEGKLAGAWVGEMRQCWRTASSTTLGRRTVLDLREVDFVDPEGEKLLSEMHGGGVELKASTPLIRALIEEIFHSPGCGRVEKATRANASVRNETS